MHRRRSTPGVSRLPPSGRVWTVRDALRRHVAGTQTNECDLLSDLQDTCKEFPEHVAIIQIHSNSAEIKLRPAWGIQKKKIAPQHWEVAPVATPATSAASAARAPPPAPSAAAATVAVAVPAARSSAAVPPLPLPAWPPSLPAAHHWCPATHQRLPFSTPGLSLALCRSTPSVWPLRALSPRRSPRRLSVGVTALPSPATRNAVSAAAAAAAGTRARAADGAAAAAACRSKATSTGARPAGAGCATRRR